LAPYKSPKSVITVATIGRAPNGKLDYKRLKQEAIDSLKA
jgi:acyl-CoA synthetase (AMP-forming)/AMP-acid ligase II